MASAILIFVIGVLLNKASCHPNVGKHANVGIVGGHQISIKSAPYMAALWYLDGEEWDQVCGASIIHEQYVLTAAQCIESASLDKYQVIVGTDNSNGVGGDVYEVEDIITHHNYSPKTEDGNYDICLIKLTKKIVLGPKVALIKIADSGLSYSKKIRFNVTGWGNAKLDSDDYPRKLRQVQVPLVGEEVCEEICKQLDMKKTSHLMCAGSIGHDTCQGDAGGPLTLNDVQVGVTSFGVGCGITAGTYVKVSTFLDWIDQNID